MSNNLLKPSTSWFLRPQHLQQGVSQNALHSTHSPEIHIFLPLEEEYSIRKYCPLTLSHLLPDLHHTRKEQEADATAEFDAILLNKFEKHLEDSHTEISGSSSEGECDGKTENCLHVIESDKPHTKFKMKILLPNKVNYPHENMKLLLPDVVLNNKRSPSPILTKGFCTGCMNRGMSLTTNFYNNNAFVKRKNDERSKFPGGDKRSVTSITFPCLKSTERNSNNGVKSTCYSKNIFERLCDESGKEIMNNLNQATTYFEDTDSSNSSSDSLQEQSRRKNISVFPSPISRSWLTSNNPESRNRGKPQSPKNFGSPPKVQDSFPIPPSPHLMELARLRREKLRIEEKMLLKRRQVLELERLRPPVERWYEMKDQHFHNEAHRNNLYVKNQKILPLIEDRRRLLYQTITS